MKGRKNMKRALEKETLILQAGQSVMQVVSLRGSNLIEVIDAKGKKSLALFPAKFQKSMWIKRGSFVMVDESGREKALESGNKVACIVSQVLFYEQVRMLQKSPDWPEIFRASITDGSNGYSQKPTPQPKEDGSNPSDDDELPPLEANLNRVRPVEFHSNADSDTDS